MSGEMGKPVDVGQHVVLERKLLLDLTVGAEVQARVRNFHDGVYKNGYLHHGNFRCNLNYLQHLEQSDRARDIKKD